MVEPLDNGEQEEKLPEITETALALKFTLPPEPSRINMDHSTSQTPEISSLPIQDLTEKEKKNLKTNNTQEPNPPPTNYQDYNKILSPTHTTAIEKSTSPPSPEIGNPTAKSPPQNQHENDQTKKYQPSLPPPSTYKKETPPLPSLPPNSEGVILPAELSISATSEAYTDLLDDKDTSEVSSHIYGDMMIFTKGDQDFGQVGMK